MLVFHTNPHMWYRKDNLYTSKTNTKYVAMKCIKIIESFTSINNSMFQDSYILRGKIWWHENMYSLYVHQTFMKEPEDSQKMRWWQWKCVTQISCEKQSGQRAPAAAPGTHHCVPDGATRPPPVSGCGGAAVNECVGLAPRDSPPAFQAFLVSVLLSETLPSQPFFLSLPPSQVSDSASSFRL